MGIAGPLAAPTTTRFPVPLRMSVTPKHQTVFLKIGNLYKYTIVDCYKLPVKIVIPNERIVKVRTGFHHTMYLTSSGQIYCHGLNNFGQCGSSNLSEEHIVRLNLLVEGSSELEYGK